MASTVYMFGAGINRLVTDFDGLHPPLISDFFQIVLKHHSLGDEHYRERIKELFKYINRYWKVSVDDLRDQPFDLETCFTLIQQQLIEAQQEGNESALRELFIIRYQLTVAFAELLSAFEHGIYRSEEFLELGKIVLAEKATVITFNYDTLVEATVESASNVRGKAPDSYLKGPAGLGKLDEVVTDEELPYSHMNWNRPLGYGIRFDDVQLHRTGLPTYVEGKRFYGHPENQLYDNPILKLHGSINWFRHTSMLMHPGLKQARPDPNPKDGQTVITSASGWRLNELPNINLWFLDPIIVTPALYKDLSDPLLKAIWQRALAELKVCHRLIVGGYSFPPTDFGVRKLFLEAFVENVPEELIVINPDTSVGELIKNFCHFKKSVLVFRDLSEFVERYHS